MNNDLKNANAHFVKVATTSVETPPSPDDIVNLLRELALGMQDVTVALDKLEGEVLQSRE